MRSPENELPQKITKAGTPSAAKALFAFETMVSDVVRILNNNYHLTQQQRSGIVNILIDNWIAIEGKDNFVARNPDFFTADSKTDIKKLTLPSDDPTKKLAYYLIQNFLNDNQTFKDPGGIWYMASQYNREQKLGDLEQTFDKDMSVILESNLLDNITKIEFTFGKETYKCEYNEAEKKHVFKDSKNAEFLKQKDKQSATDFLREAMLKASKPKGKEHTEKELTNFEHKFQYFLQLFQPKAVKNHVKESYLDASYKDDNAKRKLNGVIALNSATKSITLDISYPNDFGFNMEMELSQTYETKETNKILASFRQSIPNDAGIIITDPIIPLIHEPKIPYEISVTKQSDLVRFATTEEEGKERKITSFAITENQLIEFMAQSLELSSLISPAEVDEAARRDGKFHVNGKEKTLTRKPIGRGSVDNKLFDVLYDFTIEAYKPQLEDGKPKLAIALTKNLAKLSPKFKQYIEDNRIDLSNLNPSNIFSILPTIKAYGCSNIEKMTVNLIRHLLNKESELNQELGGETYTDAKDLFAKQWKTSNSNDADFSRNSNVTTFKRDVHFQGNAQPSILSGKFREVSKPEKALIFDLLEDDEVKKSIKLKHAEYKSSSSPEHFDATKVVKKAVDEFFLGQKLTPEEENRYVSAIIQTTVESPAEIHAPFLMANSELAPVQVNNSLKFIFEFKNEQIEATTQLQNNIASESRSNGLNFHTLGVIKRRYPNNSVVNEIQGILIPPSNTQAEFSYAVIDSDYNEEENKKFTDAIAGQLDILYGAEPETEVELISAKSVTNPPEPTYEGKPKTFRERAADRVSTWFKETWVNRKIVTPVKNWYPKSLLKTAIDKVKDNPIVGPLLGKIIPKGKGARVAMAAILVFGLAVQVIPGIGQFIAASSWIIAAIFYVGIPGVIFGLGYFADKLMEPQEKPYGPLIGQSESVANSMQKSRQTEMEQTRGIDRTAAPRKPAARETVEEKTTSSNGNPVVANKQDEGGSEQKQSSNQKDSSAVQELKKWRANFEDKNKASTQAPFNPNKQEVTPPQKPEEAANNKKPKNKFADREDQKTKTKPATVEGNQKS